MNSKCVSQHPLCRCLPCLNKKYDEALVEIKRLSDADSERAMLQSLNASQRQVIVALTEQAERYIAPKPQVWKKWGKALIWAIVMLFYVVVVGWGFWSLFWGVYEYFTM